MADVSHEELILSAIQTMSESLTTQSNRIGELTAEIKLERATVRDAPKNGNGNSGLGLFSMSMTLTLTMIAAVVTIFNGQISAVTKSVDIVRADLNHTGILFGDDIRQERTERNSSLLAIANAHKESVELLIDNMSLEREDRISADKDNDFSSKERYDTIEITALRAIETTNSLVETNKKEQIIQLKRLEEANDEIVKAVFRRLGGEESVRNLNSNP